ncbi:hypothetical protein M231_04508 [Tremella mesenterica]|uniref:Uncharacterized protein n=1 Tax=Tremella mesenterica TaxID=5217 RepID=A0A4Q1BKF3_TREME|nr:hypothetical protein M231_04508 [Tremella mesenterica]
MLSGTELKTKHSIEGSASAEVFQQSLSARIFSIERRNTSAEPKIEAKLTMSHCTAVLKTKKNRWLEVQTTDGFTYTGLQSSAVKAEMFRINDLAYLTHVYHYPTESYLVKMVQGQTCWWWRILPDGEEQWGEGGSQQVKETIPSEGQVPAVIAEGCQIIALNPLETDEAGKDLNEEFEPLITNG